MAEIKPAAAAQPGDAHGEMDLNETLLRTEIEFWQEMIHSRSDTLPQEAVERMHHALALAKRRLSGQHERSPSAAAPNVYHLDPARRKAK